MNADEAKNATVCDHANRCAVRYTDAGGRVGVRLQCQRCGQSGQNVKQNGYNVDRLPPFDQSLADRWRLHCKTVWEERWQLEQDERKQKQDENRFVWFAKYDSYLKSEHWKSVRRRVIARDSFACQLCGRRVEVNTAHVHHLSYDTYNLIGYSLPAECVTLCRSCHDRIESAKQAAA